MKASEASGFYNGSAYTASATVAGVGSQSTAASSLETVSPSLTYYSGTSASGSPLSGALTARGTYSVVASFAGSADYKTAESAATTFSITKGTPTLIVTPATGAYNGSAFVATDSVAGGASLEGVAPTLTYYKGVTALSGAPSAAGTYSVVASFAGSTDYTSTSLSTSFSIAKGTPTVTVSDNGGTANGSTAFSATATVAGMGSESTPASSLEGIKPTLQYYTGTSASGNDWSTAAPKTAGTYTVLATFPGSTDYLAASSIPHTFTVIPDPFITVISGSDQSTAVNTQFTQALVVNVVDAHGNPVSGALVTFTAPATGASGTFAGGLTTVVVATNASGTATAPAFTANGVAGDAYRVIASTPGAAVSASFTLSNN